MKVKIVKKCAIDISASVDIHNAQLKGTHEKLMIKSVIKGRWLQLNVSS